MNEPAVIHGKGRALSYGKEMPPPGHAIHTARNAHANEAAVKSRATVLTRLFLKRRPNSPLMAAPISGSRGMTQRFRFGFWFIISAGSPGQRSKFHGC